MDSKYNAFFRVLDPEDNATGGGAASAVAGAMAASLAGMVARLSIGRKNMPEPDAYYEEINREALELSDGLLAGSNADSQAFDAIMAAYRLPKDSDAEKIARSAAIQAAMEGATETPLHNAENCARVLDLARALTGRSNANAASDLECAVFLAQAGLNGALSNADINIPGIKDESAREKYQARADRLRGNL